MQKPLLIVVFIAFTLLSFAQGTFIPLGSDAYGYLERLDIKYSRIVPVEHTIQKPVLRSDAAKLAETLRLSNLRFSKVEDAQLKYLIDENAEWADSIRSKTPRPLFKKLYTEPASFYHVSSKKRGLFDLRINPMIALNIGGETESKRFLFSRSAGLEVRGNIKRVFSFYFNVTGNSERPPQYVVYNIRNQNVPLKYVPGQAYWKDYSSRIFSFSDGIDYFDARGYINVNVLKYINISFGRDKFFIGDGQRSLFLSDFSAPYFFLKFNLHFWRVNYDNIYTELVSQYTRNADRLLTKKYMAVHHLDIQATHWLRLGLFESVVFSRANAPELQYLNPIIFYRAVEHSLGSPDNVLVGGDFKANIAGHASLYGQVLLDEFNFKNFFAHNGWWANKWGLQLGLKYIDIAPNLDGQVEFNFVRPFTYTHGDSIANYTNYNQPLAHPLGANFYELIFNLHYQPVPKLSFNVKYIMARVGTDTLIGPGVYSHYGVDIFRPTSEGTAASSFGNKLGQGAHGTLNYFDFLATYQLWHNINLDANLIYRSMSTVNTVNNPIKSRSTFIYTVGIRINVARRQNAYQY